MSRDSLRSLGWPGAQVPAGATGGWSSGLRLLPRAG